MIDHLNTLNDTTPKIRTEGRKGVDPNLVFGLDSKLYLEDDHKQPSHHDEVETVTIYKGSSSPINIHSHKCEDDSCIDRFHGNSGEQTTSQRDRGDSNPLRENALKDALSKVSKETVWRVKGFARTEQGLNILNWAFGRYELTEVADVDTMSAVDVLKLTVMGERGEVKRAGRKLAEALGGSVAH